MPNLNSPSVRGPERRKTTRRRDTSGSLDRLLDGAQATFAERGYHLSNVQEICARANVGIGTFYSHFDHKNQLLEHLMVERAVALPQLLSVSDLADVAALTARLQTVLDDPVACGLWRAWHEGVAEDPALAASQARFRSTALTQLTELIAKVRRGRPAHSPRLDAAVVAWTMMLLARELAIHDRGDAPSVETIAAMILDLVFGQRKKTG
jgi:AcrR family transcriptional regulator